MAHSKNSPTVSYTYYKLILTFFLLYVNCPTVEGRGQTDDFFIDYKTVTVRGSGTTSLQITFIEDGVALEQDELLQLRLATNPDLKSQGVFVVDTLDVTIQDSDSEI